MQRLRLAPVLDPERLKVCRLVKHTKQKKKRLLPAIASFVVALPKGRMPLYHACLVVIIVQCPCARHHVLLPLPRIYRHGHAQTCFIQILFAPMWTNRTATSSSVRRKPSIHAYSSHSPSSSRSHSSSTLAHPHPHRRPSPSPPILKSRALTPRSPSRQHRTR